MDRRRHLQSFTDQPQLVNPEDGTHTQNIENKKQFGTQARD
jgi:hypothetical protein